MMKVNVIKYWYGLVLMLATISFVGCTDDNDDTEAPFLEVSPENLSFTAEGVAEEGSQAYFEIASNRDWTITVQDNKDWVTLSKTEGSGNAKIDVSVPAGAVDEAKVDIQVSNKSGVLMSKTVTIRRGAGGEPVETVVIYNETVGNDASASDKPKVDAYTGWTKKGEGAANVTYSGGADVRSSGIKSAGYEGASGENNVFFGTSPSFVINKIALTAEQTNLKLTFGGSYSKKDDAGNYNNTFDVAKFTVSLSADGTSWTPITYTKNNGDAATPYWIFATADFTLKNAVTELYIKFEAGENSVYRLDDITLATGIGGTEVDLAAGGNTDPDPEPGEATEIAFADLVKMAKENTTQVDVDATADRFFEAVVQTDVAAGNYTQNNLVLAVEGASAANQGITLYGSQVEPSTLGLTKGDKVKVTLYKGLAKAVNFSGLYEVTGGKDDTWCKIEKIGTAEITPIVLTDISNLAEYQGTTVTVNNVTSPATSAVWGASAAHVFTVGGANLNIFVKTTSDFATTTYQANATGSVTGVATVYKNATQIVPRTIADVNDFTSGAPFISKVEPATLSFPLAGGEKEVTVTGSNLEGKTLTVSGVSAPVSAEVNGNVVKVTVSGATAAATQTMTISVEGGNSQTVTINIADVETNDAFLFASGKNVANAYEAAINGDAGIKLGTGSKCGTFKTGALNVSDAKTLSFYAVAWKGKKATLYVKVEGGGAVEGTAELTLAANDGAADNTPFTITPQDTDKYTISLTGLTESSTIYFSTDAAFGGASSSTAGRAILWNFELK